MTSKHNKLQKVRHLTLKHFKPRQSIKYCYDRDNGSNLSVVDSHLHLRPFNGKPLPYKKFINLVRHAGVLFVAGYGIGQTLPITSKCHYYLDCPEEKVVPSMRNDFANAQKLQENRNKNIIIGLSMTFPNLHKPQDIVQKMKLLEREFPNTFHGMGEVNLVKQAIFPNGHTAVPMKTIYKWKKFMHELRIRDMPIAIHADLGDNKDNYKYLPLMLKVLELYPKNKIIWMHLGLSQQLSNVDVNVHVQLLDNLLQKYTNLFFDIAWRVLYDEEFKDKTKEASYINLLNRWPKRFLPGTDFISSIDTKPSSYVQELKVTSKILTDVNDNTYRRIALGQNYFDLARLPYKAPKVCKKLL